MQTNILLPADTYTVINKTILNDQDRKLLISLYQPIIGNLAISLYFSLWSYLDKTELCSLEWTHHHLMGNMGTSMDELLIAREKLEAIGLIKSYVKKDNVNRYIYELYSPLSAREFFQNPILTTALYRNIGYSEYEKVIAYFKNPKFNLKDYEDVTKSLSDVFEIVPMDISTHTDDIRSRSKRKLELVSKIDLDTVLALIPGDILNLKSITKDTKDLIYRLGFVYDFDNNQILELIRNSINEKKAIDKQLIRKNARNYYTFENNGKLPSMVYKNQPEYLRKPVGDTSPQAKVIYQFETTSPYDFLVAKNHGATPSKTDKAILEYLLIELGMMPGVVNVLIDYVLKINNNKLTKNFVSAIASQWVRSDVKTVDSAMKLARKEVNLKKKTSISKAKTKTVATKPTWFDQKLDKKEATDEELNEMKSLIEQFK